MKVYIKAELLIYDGTNFDEIVTQLVDTFKLNEEDLEAEHDEKSMTFTYGENDIDVGLGDGILILPEFNMLICVLKKESYEVYSDGVERQQ